MIRAMYLSKLNNFFKNLYLTYMYVCVCVRARVHIEKRKKNLAWVACLYAPKLGFIFIFLIF